MLYCYNNNNIVYYDYFGNRIVDWHKVGDPDFPEDLEDLDDGLVSWQYSTIVDMAEEFHDSNQFFQLPANLQEFVLELKEINFSVKKRWAEILEEEIPTFEECEFGSLKRVWDAPERLKKGYEEMADNMNEEENQMWNEIQINGIIPDNLQYI
jgi:hypothetical protein